MTSETQTDGSSYIPIREAAQKAGLTADYIRKLCRKGFIRGQERADGWYVVELSLNEWLKDQARRKEKWRKQQSQLRREEMAHWGNGTPERETYAQHALRAAIAQPPITTVAPHSLSHRAPLARRRRVTHEIVMATIATFALVASGASIFQTVTPGSLARTQLASVAWLDQVGSMLFRALCPIFDDCPRETKSERVPLASVTSPAQRFLQQPSTRRDQATSSGSARTNSTIVNQRASPSGSQEPVRVMERVYVEPVERVVERVLETQRIVSSAGGLTEEILNARLGELESSLSSQIYAVASVGSANSTQIVSNYNAVGGALRIDELSKIALKDSTITGGTISGATISGGSISASSITGTISAALDTALATIANLTTTELVAINSTTTNATTTNLYVSGTARLASPLAIASGGTGTSSAPTYGKVLLGNSSGTYDLVATSSLGISGGSGSPGGSDTQVQFNSSGAFAASANFTFSSSSNLLKVGSASTTLLSLFDRLYVGGTATTTIRGDGFASTLPYASSTALTVSGTGYFTVASTTNLTISGIQSSLLVAGESGGVSGTTTLSVRFGGTGSTTLTGLLKGNGVGALLTAIPGTDYVQSTTGDWTGTLDGLEGSSYLANSFSTTSANYWQTTRSFFATSSTDYWETQQTARSADDLTNNSIEDLSDVAAITENYGDLFYWNGTAWADIATSSLAINTSNLVEGSNLFFTDARVQSFIHSSSTIPKTYTANVFTALQTFGNASTTNLSASYASSTQGFFGALSIGNLSGFLKATAGAVATALIDLASDITGILPVANGGTGWANIASAAIPYGNGSSALATTTAGTPGQVLALLNGVPTWAATSTLSTISGTISGTQLDGVFGSNGLLARTTTGTYASRTITGTANQITVANGDGVSGNPTLSFPALLQFGQASSTLFSAYGPAYFGATATSTFGADGSLTLGGAFTASTNSTLTNATTSFLFVKSSLSASSAAFGATATSSFSTAGALTLASALSASSGGTGISNPTAAGILLGSYAGGGWQQLATSSLGLLTTNVAEGSNLYYTDARVQSFVHGSSTIPKTYTSNTFTGTNTFSSLTLGSLDGPLQANNGALSATSSIGILYGGTGATSASGARTNLAAAASGANADITSLSALSFASTTRLSVFDIAYFGGSATSTFDSAGKLTFQYASTSNALTVSGTGFFGTASTTNLTVSGSPSGVLVTSSSGAVSASSTLGVNVGGTGATSLNDLITLGTHTSGNYVATVAGTANQITVSGSGSETAAVTLSLPSLVSLTQASSTRLSIFDRLYVGDTATTSILGSATSTFGAGLQTTALNITSTSATSTGANGWNLTAGCFAVNGTCVGGGSASFANPSASIGLTAVNGSASTAMRSDAAPALSQAIAPTWTGLHQFTGGASSTILSVYNNAYFGATATSSFSSAGALTLATDLAVTEGGTGGSTLTGLLQGNGTSAITGITGTAGQFPYYNGTNTLLATSSIYLATSGNVGIGTTSPGYALDVAGDVNFTGRLREDGNEILANMIAPFAGSCPTGWSEYTAARGRAVVGTPSAGTNAGTVGTALTNLGSTTITDVPSHLHTVDPPATVSDSQGTHTHTIPTGTGAGSNAFVTPTRGVSSSLDTGSDGAHTHTTDIASFNSGSTGLASVDVTMPYIQLTYCQKAAGADIAEWIPASEDIGKATIVSADPGNREKVIASRTAYDNSVVGVVATQPGWLLGQEAKGSVQMALAGRVPMRVSLKNGEIRIGDPITTSSIPGVGMKATKPTVGKAMEAVNETSSLTACTDPSTGRTEQCATALVFVNISWYSPTLDESEDIALQFASAYTEPLSIGADFETGDIVALEYRYPQKQGNSDRTEKTGYLMPAIPGSLAVGVVSTEIGGPGNLLRRVRANNKITQELRLVESGKADMRISPNSTPIKVGDPLTVSPKDQGMGAKAEAPGFIIGRALEEWGPSSGKKSISVLLDASWYAPPTEKTEQAYVEGALHPVGRFRHRVEIELEPAQRYADAFLVAKDQNVETVRIVGADRDLAGRRRSAKRSFDGKIVD